MQTVIIYITLFFTGLILQAQVNTIELTIAGIDSNDGKVLIGLYNSEANWLNKRYKGEVAEIIDNKAMTTFTDIPDGIYAISSIHDADNNGKLNMRMGFYPTEDTASSNNAPARFGPPSWEDAKFEVRGGKVVTQSISM